MKQSRCSKLPTGTYRRLVRTIRPELLEKLPGPKVQRGLFEQLLGHHPTVRTQEVTVA